jgi:hypothetical protein
LKTINVAQITFFTKKTFVTCDRKCNKAWGINSRPKEMLSDHEDDFYYLSDAELGDAPINPGTYECDEAKPLSPDEFPNKWCVRECERCSMSSYDDPNTPLPPKTFDDRVYNLGGRKGVTI